MNAVPANPKLYHITHVNNLPGIVTAGQLVSDAERIAQGLECELVGMSKIKRRRLEELDVDCHPGTKVGEYVPFYFCPRSIMLYLLHMGNHPELTYTGGQGVIVHLQADLQAVVDWANQKSIRWAFSATNAGAYYTHFYADLSELGRVNWPVIAQTDFRDPMVKEAKQAEFLLYGSFPWTLIESIGVFDADMVARVDETLRGVQHRPPVSIQRSWYY